MFYIVFPKGEYRGNSSDFAYLKGEPIDDDFTKFVENQFDKVKYSQRMERTFMLLRMRDIELQMKYEDQVEAARKEMQLEMQEKEAKMQLKIQQMQQEMQAKMQREKELEMQQNILNLLPILSDEQIASVTRKSVEEIKAIREGAN